jgi:hypothetical protein
MKKWILMPSKYVAGEKALVIGWAVMMATACIARCGWHNGPFRSINTLPDF